jgi:hypothetical protein
VAVATRHSPWFPLPQSKCKQFTKKVLKYTA